MTSQSPLFTQCALLFGCQRALAKRKPAVPSTNTRERPCSCPRSPFCQGAASPDWLTCSATCATCQPPSWRPPIRHGADGRPIKAADPSNEQE